LSELEAALNSIRNYTHRRRYVTDAHDVLRGFHVVRKTSDVLRCCSICELSTSDHFLIVLYQTQPLVPTREINRRSRSEICRLLWNPVIYFIFE